jgi:class 3 adenylate cyclase
MSCIEPVQICAGVDWGRVCVARTGTPDASEVNVVGHPANFAAKSEKKAGSWEIVVGEAAAGHITNRTLPTAHPDSAKTYQHRGQRRSFAFYQLAWQQIAAPAAAAIGQVSGRPSSGLLHVVPSHP